jgi:Extracellular mutant protein 11
MPRELQSFVRDRNGIQSQPNPPTTKYFENRRAIAEGAKIKPKTAFGQTPQAIPQYRPTSTVNPITTHPVSVESRQHHDLGELDGFETTLEDDSDDTTMNSVCEDDSGDNLEYQRSQRNHKTEEELPEDEYADEEEIEGGVGNSKPGDRSWDRPVTGNSPFQSDRRFQILPERNQAPKLSASQQATLQNLRLDPKFAQILVKKDEKGILHNNPNKREQPYYAQPRTGRFENTTDKQYSNQVQMYTGQNGNRNTEQTISRHVRDEPETLSPRQGFLDEDSPVVGIFNESYGSLSRESSPSERTPKAKRLAAGSATIIPEPVSIKRTAIELDYDKNTLFNMKYSELKEQAFDDDPKAAPLEIPDHLVEPNFLSDRLQHFASLGPDAQTRFFAQMPKGEWDKSGDWFIDRFADIISKLKDSRQAKRDISRAFEDELAAREGALRSKSEEIDKTLRAMKQGGESVLKGRVKEDSGL